MPNSRYGAIVDADPHLLHEALLAGVLLAAHLDRCGCESNKGTNLVMDTGERVVVQKDRVTFINDLDSVLDSCNVFEAYAERNSRHSSDGSFYLLESKLILVQENF